MVSEEYKTGYRKGYADAIHDILASVEQALQNNSSASTEQDNRQQSAEG